MKMCHLRASLCGLSLTLITTLAFNETALAQRAAAGPPDWPCVQRLIPELSWGTLWSGPSPETLEQAWWDDAAVGRVVRFATARRTPPADALARVREFVAENDGDERRLTLLFAGLFERMNHERSRTIEGIRSAARAQVARLEEVSSLVDELESLRDSENARQDDITQAEKALHWERRTFQMRQQALPALCEKPYLLEEQLGRMVRLIEEQR